MNKEKETPFLGACYLSIEDEPTVELIDDVQFASDYVILREIKSDYIGEIIL